MTRITTQITSRALAGGFALASALWAVRVAAAPATPLYSLQIRGIASNNVRNGEPISEYQLATSQDHGGTEIAVLVHELGYSSSRWATFNGLAMREVANQPIVDYSRNIVGWWREWRVNTRFTSGTVLIGARPINVGRELSDRVNVR